jgi:hypothetical protein
MIKVIDLEVNKEFNLVEIRMNEGIVIIQNDEYGTCNQLLSKIKFTNKHLANHFEN